MIWLSPAETIITPLLTMGGAWLAMSAGRAANSVTFCRGPVVAVQTCFRPFTFSGVICVSGLCDWPS